MELELLRDLLVAFGLPAVIGWLVEQGYLPSWVADVLGLSSDQAKEHEPFNIETMVQNAELAIINPYYGLQAINAKIQRSANDYAAILAAIANISTQVSNLPAPPSTGAIAAEVWLVPPFEGEDTGWNHLTYLERYAALTSLYGSWPWKQDPRFVVAGSFKYPPD